MSPKRPPDTAAAPGRIWLQTPKSGSRGPVLTRERITEAAIGILDTTGEAGLSMRAVAHELQVHATSLYWHIATRDDLLDLALDAAFGEIDRADGIGGTPLDRVAVYMDGLRAALLRHPWAAALAGTRPLLGPNALAHAENVHAVLVACGFTGPDLSAAAATVTNHVIASVATQAAARHGDGAEVRRALAAHLNAHADRYPTLAVHPPAIEDDWDGHYRRGRDLLLAGLATHADSRRGG